MTSQRIKEIQEGTAYPESLSVKQALLQVWNECEQEFNKQSSITAVSCHREQLKAFADFIQSDTSHMNYDFKDLVQEYLDSL